MSIKCTSHDTRVTCTKKRVLQIALEGVEPGLQEKKGVPSIIDVGLC